MRFKFWLIIMVIIFTIPHVHSKDLGQWENTDPETKEWYQGLMQPDNPAASCCGEADAYWCDEIHVRDVTRTDNTHQMATFCRITDDRADEPLKRRHIDRGTEFEIPDYKLKWNKGNPTGHAILFISRGDYVYCFVQAGGT